MELDRLRTYHPPVAELQVPFHSVELEQQFRQEWYRSSLRQIRASVALAIVLLLAFSQLDVHYFSKDVIAQIFWFRWLVMIPLCVAVLAVSWLSERGELVFVLMTFTLCVMTGFFTRLLPQLDVQALSYLLLLLVQLALFQLVLLRIPFRISLLGSLFALAAIAASFSQFELESHQRVSIIAGFAAIHGILLFSSYQRERQQRSLFMGQQQLKQSLADRQQIREERASWYQNLARFLRHELSNQLVGARTSLQLVERFSDRQAEYLGRARESLERMQLMLNETSDASSVEDALKSEEREVFDLSLLVAECVTDYRDQYSEKLFEVQRTHNLSVSGQPFRVTQLLDKLVANAVRHSNAQAPIEIRLALAQSPDWVELSVSNRGAALPQDLDSLFDLWSTSATYADDHRLGLGLFVAARVAQAHGGHIQAVRLERPEGARFIVTLPLARLH
ncbi:MAG: sensor histidine kinase [Pseudomonadales bacterium]